MITVTEYKNQKIGVFGLGKAGKAAVFALAAGGAQVFSWDDKLAQDIGDATNEAIENWPWAELKALVLSPGVPLTHPRPHKVVELAKKYNVPIVGEVELLFRACPEAKFIGITGTNGKSTTTTLIGHILQQSGIECEVGGNLGTPALALRPLGKGGVYVIEMSSYQLDLLHSVRFNVAVLLNITPDHLDRHGDMAGYIAAKYHIFDHQQESDTAIVSIDDDYCKQVYTALYKGKRQKVVAVSVRKSPKEKEKQPAGNNIFVSDFGTIYEREHTTVNGRCLDISSILSLTGHHNWQNAAAAYAAARAVGIAPEKIYAAMQNFAGLRHRLQLVKTINGVKFINDSKATNADATANALAPYNNIYWIAGGKPKAGGIASLENYFPHITHAFLIGEAEGEFAATLEGKVPYTRCGTLEVALQKAAEMALSPSLTLPRKREREQEYPLSPKGGELERGVVLLSPACASFDQFKSFEHRGDVFCGLVESLEISSAI